MPARTERTKHPGVYRVHRRTCTDRGSCTCPAAYQAVVSTFREGKRIPIRKHFESIKAACQWRQDASSAARAGKLPVPTRITLWQAAEDLLDGMRGGRIYDRSGRPYKPSTVRGYATHLRIYILPVLGHLRLSTITRRELQQLLERLQGEPLKLSASTIRNVLCPLQVIFGRALHDEQLAVDPTIGLRLPAARGKRDRIASVEEARALRDALAECDRALWSVALYAGLRRGELQALRWRNVDFEQRVIRVEKSWDQVAGEIDVKTKAARRTVPMEDGLRRELVAHKLRTGRTDDELVFGRTPHDAFVPSTVRLRALEAWATAELEPIGLHEARHCAASFFIASRMGAKELSVYMGHSSIKITFDTYGHLMPGGLAQAADRLSAFLDAASG
jgi:integrase